jgi:hypothetical protein
MEVIRSSETSVYIRSTRRHIPEDGVLHSHRRENLKSYNRTTVYRTFHVSYNPRIPFPKSGHYVTEQAIYTGLYFETMPNYQPYITLVRHCGTAVTICHSAHLVSCVGSQDGDLNARIRQPSTFIVHI